MATQEHDSQCPVPGGEFGIDFAAYEQCGYCELRERCKEWRQARAEEWNHRLGFPRYLILSTGLFADRELSDHDRVIIALVAFRQTSKYGHSYDTNEALRRLLGLSKQRISAIVSSLVERGYLVVAYQGLKRKRKDSTLNRYRTGRKLGLGIKAVRLINMFAFDDDTTPLAHVCRNVP